jgi:peptidoglycan hydrolase-like protein with peptidoglycan-binding domain
VERAFHTNPAEEKLLLDPAISAKAAKAMADAIHNYLKNEPEGGTDRMLKKGMSGSDVKKLQEMLIQLGYGSYMEPYGADGIFGEATERAVLAFQKNNGLDPDGIVGPLTMGKIQELLKQAPEKSPIPRNYGEVLERTVLLRSQVQDMSKKLTKLSMEMDILAKELEALVAAMKGQEKP